jgi:hypothetical protein
MRGRDRPARVLGVENAVAVAAGFDQSTALLADGTVMTWGYVPAYQDSTGSKGFSKVPVRLELVGLRNS